jgi:hypothetical protein
MKQLELEWRRRERLVAPPFKLEAAEQRQLVEQIGEAIAAVVRAAQEATDER